MLRRLSLLVVMAVGFSTNAAEAGIRISPNNPFRSFNTSGVNYGSMQWEKQQQKSVRHYSSGYRAAGRR